VKPSFPPAKFLLALILGFSLPAVVSVRADSYTWAPQAGGLYTWQTPNWNTVASGTYPRQAGDVANLTIDIVGSQTISLNNQEVTIGTLNIGDATASHAYTINTGTLTLAGLSGQAAGINVNYTPGGPRLTYTVNSAVSLGSDLAVNGVTSGTDRINFTSTIATNGRTLTLNASSTFNRTSVTETDATIQINALSGNGKLVTTGPGYVYVSGSSGGYTGAVEVRGGRLGLNGTGSYLGSTDITVYGNALPGLGAGGTVFEIGKTGFSHPVDGYLNDNAVVTLRGGGFSYVGNVNAGISSEVFKEIVLAEGNSNISIGAGAAGTSETEIHLTDLTRRAGATGQIKGGTGLGLSAGTAKSTRIFVTNAPALTGGGGAVGTPTVGIIPWLAGAASAQPGDDVLNFVTYDPTTGLRPLTSGEYAATLTSGTATINANVGNTALAASSTVNALRYSGANALSIAAAQELKVTSGAVLFTSSGSITGSGTLNFAAAEGIVWSVRTATNTISSAIAGSGGFTKAGTGVLVLSGANAFTGTVSVAGGVLRAGAANVFGGTNAVVLANTTVNNVSPNSLAASTTTLDLNGFNQTIGSLAGGGEYGGTVQLGSGTLTTGGNNSSTTYSGSIGGSGAVVKTGSGRQTFTGASGYTGGTAVNLGTLLANNNAGSATGTGAVAVNASGSTSFGTLGGGSGAANGGTLVALGLATSQVYDAGKTGIIAGSVTLNQYAHLAPGNSVGTLTVGELTLNGGSVLDWEFNLTANDFVDVRSLAGSSGTLTFVGVTGINLYQEGTQTALAAEGLYNLFGYDAVTGFNVNSLSVLNGLGGYTYTFINDTTNNLIQVSVAVPEPSTLILLGLAGVLCAARRRR